MDPENLNSGTPPKTEMKNSAVKTIGQFFFLKIQEKSGAAALSAPLNPSLGGSYQKTFHEVAMDIILEQHITLQLS